MRFLECISEKCLAFFKEPVLSGKQKKPQNDLNNALFVMVERGCLSVLFREFKTCGLEVCCRTSALLSQNNREPYFKSKSDLPLSKIFISD